MDIGNRIKELREQKHMTLEELGNKVGVGKSTVRKWEIGMIANMRRDKIAKLASALHVTPAYLMGWEEAGQTTEEDEQIRISRLIENSRLIDESILERMLAAGGKLPKENLEAFVQAMEMAAAACEQFK